MVERFEPSTNARCLPILNHSRVPCIGAATGGLCGGALPSE